MPDFVEGTIAEIDRRLAELGEEASRLNAARAALLGPNRPQTEASTSGTQPPRRRGRPRGRRASTGSRAEQAVTLIRENPGITIPQLAQKLGIQPNYLYRVVPTLVSKGLITKNGSTLNPAADVAEPKVKPKPSRRRSRQPAQAG